MIRPTRILWLLSLATVVVQAGASITDLPGTLATHFDWNGTPNGWSSKTGFYFLWGVIVLVVNVWVPIVPRMVRRLSPTVVSVPNKEYWLQDEAHKERFVGRLSSLLEIVLTLSNLICIAAFQIVVQYNTEGKTRIGPEILIGLILVVLVVSLIYPFLAFRVPGKDR